MCLRQGQSSRIARVFVEASQNDFSAPINPQAVGWERDGTGKLASRVANLGPMLDPSRYAPECFGTLADHTQAG